MFNYGSGLGETTQKNKLLKVLTPLKALQLVHSVIWVSTHSCAL